MIQFSVILINYNHAAYLQQRIDSILQQSFTGFELLILDDASTDNSRVIIEQYRDHPAVAQIIYADTNSGSAYFHWKQMIALAKANWIWIAEADDVADPDFLTTAASSLAMQPQAGLFYCNTSIIKSKGELIPEDFANRKNRLFATEKWDHAYVANGISEIKECLQYDCTINNDSSMVFKKELALPFLNEVSKYTYYGDWYFMLQLCFHTDLVYTNKTLNAYRKHSESLLHKNNTRITETHEYFRILQLLYYNDNITDQKKLLDQFALHYLGFGLLKEGWRNSLRIVRLYYKQDRKLARAIIWRWCLMRIPGNPFVKSAFNG